MIETFNFEKALSLLREGKKVSRVGWNGSGMFIELQTPTETSKMKRPYIFMSPVDGNLVPWVTSHYDFLS